MYIVGQVDVTQYVYTHCAYPHNMFVVSLPGAEGNVDGSLQLMKEVDEVKLKKKQAEDEYHALIPRHAVQQQKLKACEVKLCVHVYTVLFYT